jgi:hypothetical protein
MEPVGADPHGPRSGARRPRSAWHWLPRCLPEDLGQPHDGNRAGGNDDGQHLTRFDRWQLVDIANDQERGIVRHRLHQRLHQHDVDH